MAKVIPSGVLKLPNFAELDYNLKRQKTQDALKAEEFSSQFKEITGNYLAGDLEAVQSSYDAVEEARDRLATDPTNVTLIRALRTAHANHAKVAGTAQFLANNNRELKANFIANPDAYSEAAEKITSTMAMSMPDDYSLAGSVLDGIATARVQNEAKIRVNAFHPEMKQGEDQSKAEVSTARQTIYDAFASGRSLSPEQIDVFNDFISQANCS